MNLDEFLAAERARIDRFESWWRGEHARFPEGFPMSFPPDNAGMWDECLQTFPDPDFDPHTQDEPNQGCN